jgi:hypothetical protein
VKTVTFAYICNLHRYALVDVDELAAWAASLAPRSIHDFKPMVILLQGLLQLVINGRLRFFSGDVMDLKRAVMEMRAGLQSLPGGVRLVMSAV